MSDKVRIEIDLILPDVPDARDACIRRLADLLQRESGIDAVHVSQGEGARSNEICIHYDPTRRTLGEVRGLARHAGAKLNERYGHLLLHSVPMHARQARAMSSRIAKIPGVLEVLASPTGVLSIEFDRDVSHADAIQNAVQEIGVKTFQPPLARPPAERAEAGADNGEESHEHENLFGERTELIFALICGGFLLAGWLVELYGSTSWTAWGCYLAAYFFGGIFTLREAIENIRDGRFEIDFLMLVAAAGAAALGNWFEGSLLLFLFSMGHALEHYAMGRAKRAIEALSELAPRTARVRRNNETMEVKVEELKPGDLVIIKPNERIPADGFVVKGEGSVNQAPITGESVPADKRPVDDVELAAKSPERLAAEHFVFAGTINQSGALEVQATKAAADSTLARVVKLVNEAETQKSPTQRFADRFERYFVPAIITFDVLLLFAWVVINEPFRESFYRAMAVLVAASPCALAISTPSAVLSGVARAARGGVLVKGGGPLESLGIINAIAFDKTGTLTAGTPRLVDVVTAEGVSENELLSVAIAVEALSDHPLAAAVVKGGRERIKGVAELEAHDLQSVTGRGVKASIDGQPVFAGKHNLFQEIDGPQLPEPVRREVERLESHGRTTMIFRQADRYLGVLGLMDTPRDAAKEVISKLRGLGVKRMIMLSGDNQQVANSVAKAVGIDEAWGDLMPENKVDAIKKLAAEGGVAMIGDGVNDAPALANATVGVAMGAAGSDVALETADVALMADDLRRLPFAVGLSRRTSRVIRQNLFFSLGMVAVLIPATLLGLQMHTAVAFHEGSTLLVVFNALRLLGYREV